MATNMLQKGDVLSVNAAAREIGVRNVTLYRWTQAGKASYVMFGGIMFIPVTEVERLRKEKNKQTAED
ncbi:hypothetical protein ES703_70797 [subsurface metagenome]